jgi:hypothetical protein
MQVRLLWTAASAAVAILILPMLVHADSLPSMRNDQKVECLKDTEGRTWRVQCDGESKVCLYAPNRELSSSGAWGKPLERVRRCEVLDIDFDPAAFKVLGYSMQPGRVDVSHGWTRDERGRVFQTNFDLKRRMYFGASYNPEKFLGEIGDFGRAAFNFGFLVLEHRQGRNTHRLRLVEGKVRVEPFSSEMVLLHYDLSRRFLDPLLRITTFAGEPRRHDLHLDIGLWTEAGQVEVHHTKAGDSTLWRFGTVQGTIDLWQSASQDSFLRLRTGIGFERLYTDKYGDRSALTGSTALELDMVLDDKGFHNLHGELTWEVPRYFSALTQDRLARRNTAKIQYEGILLAINDQPISFTAGIGGEQRNDLPVLSDAWAFVADAGLRVSLWAPPKRP